MNPQDTDLPDSDSRSGEALNEPAPAPKPRRRRTTSAAVAAEVSPALVVVDAPAVAVPVPVDAAAEPVSPKPKRTRKKPVAGVESAVDLLPAALPAAPSAAEVFAVPPPATKPVPPTEPVQRIAAAPVALQRGEPAEALRDSGNADAEAATEGAADGDVQGSGEAAADGAAGTDGPRRRNRNRRRGRRGNADRVGAPTEGEGALAQPAVDARGDDEDDEDDDDAPAATPPAPLPPVDAGETFADVLSGAYDAVPPEDIEAVPERRVLAAEPDAPKLHKVLAQSGIGSRRDMEQLIADGQVTVNGQVAHTGQRISFGDQIRVQGKPVKVRIAPPLPRVIAYHKPVGEVVTNDDPQHRPTVFRRLPRLPQGKWQSVGRLDINTEGLLLFTNSGEMANQLMHPRFGVEREYAVRVLGTLDQDGRESLLEGVEIDGQRAAFKSIADGGGEGVNHWYRVVITEGRNREVRKLFDTVGLAVSRLIRIRYGCVVLPRGLKRGVYVDLNEAEVRELRRMAGGRDVRENREAQGSRPPQGQDGGGKSRRNRRGGQQGRGDRAPDRPDRGGDRIIDRSTDRPFERPEPGEGGPIPNPLQQTFDKRAIREASRQPKREYSEDGPIPNPLEQTYDKRFVQKPRGIGGGGGGGGRNRGGDQGGQPDPLKTAVGYIGADAFVRKFQNNGGGGGGGGGGGRGGRRRGGR